LCLKPDKMKSVGDFRRLTQLLTAILAYQKYYE
jgi:CRISPR/Cas system CSM-associated protein Csm2 small subunit